MKTSIPRFNKFGLLPPIHPGVTGDSGVRSPYHVSVVDFCKHFGTNLERCSILDGFLRLRADLVKQELTGFQWVNGSFVSNVEVLENRPPKDIDVVTFAPLGNEDKQWERCDTCPKLIIAELSIEEYRVDHYLVATDQPLDADLASEIAFWYSFWSSQKNKDMQKGFVCVSLPEDDEQARTWLLERTKELTAQKEGARRDGDEIGDAA